MKRIGIDARLINQTGVGRYIKNLLFFLPENDELSCYLYLLKEDFEKFNWQRKNFIKRKAHFRWHSFSEQFGFLKVLNRDQLDLMHFTYFSYPIFYEKPFIATIHDLTPLLFKTGKASTKNRLFYEMKHFFFNTILSKQVRNAKAIITPTQTVKSQLLEKYGSKWEKKIFPIYEGIDYQLTAAQENVFLKRKFPKDFFIYVGNFYPHKNVESLIKAFALIKSDARLILLGPNDYFTKRLIQLINQLSQENRIILFKNPTNEDLVFFYKNALALIHPSFSEGFGLPLLEASYFHCPVIASNIPVFREILKDQYLKFNPYDVEDIKHKIETFIKKPKIFDLQILLKQYSFKKMALKTLKLYKKCLL